MSAGLKISEMFLSIQGEGKRAGSLSFFIRTNHCNLRCKFSSGNLCDTPYTSWFPDNKDNLGIIPISEIVKAYSVNPPPNVVITGGEPGMYGEKLIDLCNELRKVNPGIHITLETNGTYPGKYLESFDLISVSPKLASSVPIDTSHRESHERQRINPDALKQINSLHRLGLVDVQWKFVYTGVSDVGEIKQFQILSGFRNSDVYLMPEGITGNELELKRMETAETAIRHGWNYTDRLHIMIWGNKRGV
ncbi:MAG: hypothetical protein B6D43_05245 [Ignavibacteriales bacterium UTCHB1]|jgi:Organic radical activating enzymes|nr:MAG: hypothetical protein B6D43_05245 [Ignavibacteriales bacterium UTCHB1]